MKLNYHKLGVTIHFQGQYGIYLKKDRVEVILTNPPFGGMEEPGIESNFPSGFRTKETADLFSGISYSYAKKWW